jgi:hypothetical protein
LESGRELQDLNATLANGSKIIVVKIDNQVDTDAKEAVEAIKQAGITSLDLVIANSGLATVYGEMVRGKDRLAV